MILAYSSDVFIVMEWYKWGGIERERERERERGREKEREKEREKGLEIFPKNLI
jgi:hypothetical protein